MNNSLLEAERFVGLLWTGLCVFGLIVAFGLLGLTTVRLRSWFRDGDGPADDADTFLTAMLDSQRQGVVSPEEFRSIHGEMVRRRPGSESELDSEPPAATPSPDGSGRDASDSLGSDAASPAEMDFPDADRTQPDPHSPAAADSAATADHRPGPVTPSDGPLDPTRLTGGKD